MTERLDRFMARANALYYATHDPFADFVTAPEIAQMFGELLGAWAAVCWGLMGRPTPVILAEAGPGRGTLMADALRGLARPAPGFIAAHELHLIETSPRLRALQSATLPHAIWHDALEDVPAGPIILIANEFLDALPIRQFVRHGARWSERFVRDGAFIERPARDAPTIEAADGDVMERNDAARAWVATLATRIAIQGGAALLLDYGPTHSAPGDSLQALRDGQPTDPLADPGAADLTAHVDFEALAATAEAQGAKTHGPIPQGALLERLGLFLRTLRLSRGLSAAEGLALMEAARRLALPERMGRLFKALAICHPALPTPPGFEP